MEIEKVNFVQNEHLIKHPLQYLQISEHQCHHETVTKKSPIFQRRSPITEMNDKVLERFSQRAGPSV